MEGTMQSTLPLEKYVDHRLWLLCGRESDRWLIVRLTAIVQ